MHIRLQGLQSVAGPTSMIARAACCCWPCDVLTSRHKTAFGALFYEAAWLDKIHAGGSDTSSMAF